MKTEPFALDLPHELTTQEMIAKGAELSRTLDEREHIEAEKKAANSGFKARVEEKNQVVRRLSECIRTGKEMRPFECFERMNMAERLIETVRSDRIEVVSSRPMTPDEHQLHMDEVLSRMEKKAKQQQDDDKDLVEAAGAVVAAASSGGKREHLALPANTIDATPPPRKKKSGAERIREKKAAEAASKSSFKGKSTAAKAAKGAPKAPPAKPKGSKQRTKSKPKPVLTSERFIDARGEDA